MQTTTVILARNCEATIQRTLTSAVALTDEVLVIDTGSRDATTELVRSTPKVTLHRVRWEDSFAAARNLAFDLVPDGLLFNLDSDEWVKPDEVEHGRELLHQLRAVDRCWSPVVRDVSGHSISHHVPRIVSAQSPLRYRYRVHEQLFNGDQEMKPEDIALTVHHDGYTEEAKRRFNKLRRNMRLLRMSLKEYPNDLRLLFFWLRDGLETRGPEDNRRLVHRIDEIGAEHPSVRNDNLRVMARKVLLDHEWNTRGAHTETVATAKELLELVPDDADANYVVGMSELIEAHQGIHSSLNRLAAVRQRIGEDDLEWSMTTTPVHLDALIGEQLRTLGDRRCNDFMADVSPTWTDPYFDRSVRRGLS